MKTELPPDAATLAYYNSQASEYAAETERLSMSAHTGHLASMLRPGAHVLDVGCGSGRDLRRFFELGHRPVGLDISHELAKHAHTATGLPVVVGNMLRLPVATSTLDAAWASASLLHLSRPGVIVSLRELNRTLAPGGHLFCSVKAGTGQARDNRGRLFTYFSPEEWMELLETSGFQHSTVTLESSDAGAYSAGRHDLGWIVSFSKKSRS